MIAGLKSLPDTPTPKRLPHRDRVVDSGRALELRLRHGLSYDEIGKLLGVDRRTVWASLQKWKSILDVDVTAYKANRTELLTAIEHELLFDMAQAAKREKASLNNSAYAFQQVYNARRLEEGKSTSNVNIAAITASILELEEKEKLLEAELSQYDSPNAT